MIDLGRYVILLRKVEAQYPNWTTSRLLDSLRQLGGIDNSLFRDLLATQLADVIVGGSSLLSARELDELRSATMHNDIVSGTPESGLAFDTSTARGVAMSHVIAGICGGIHRPEPIVPVEVGPLAIPGRATLLRRTLNLDPLYAVTMAGDLGQIAARNQVFSVNNTSSAYGGVGTDATAAELVGDIDGFLLGNWLSATTAGQNVRRQLVQGNNVRFSKILVEYYRTEPNPILGMRAGSGDPLEAIRRFSNYNTSLNFITDELYAQSLGFHRWYVRAGEGSRNDILCRTAVADFIRWCGRGGK
jgi:hypothetical protein